MAGSIPAASGRIFMSYRREETAYPAGWLYDRMADRYSGGQVFKDVDSIELGDDFVEVITRAVGSCDVLLALIGNEWLTITDAQGQRRLDDPDDFVRLEIEAALTRNVRVIPILVDGARMPRADELPASLARLVRRQALELSPSRFDFDTSRLLKVLDRTLAEVRTEQDDAASMRGPAEKASDLRTTELPKAPERREQTEPSATPSIPPAAPATPLGPSPSDSGRPPGKQRRRLSTRTRVLAGAGVGVVLILLVVAIVANSEKVIFQDDFSSREAGWTYTGSDLVGGNYQHDAYRIRAEPDAEAGSVPESASNLLPSAPLALSIEVETRRLAGSSLDAQYGIACRIGEEWESFYAFIVANESVSIVKRTDFGDTTPLATSSVDMTGTNQLAATCEGDDSREWAYLQLLVNGEKVVEWTDEDSPLPAGTVGLFAATGAEKAAEVEFDNFVVKS